VWGGEWDGVDAYYAFHPTRVGPTPQPWAQLLIDDRPMLELARENGDPAGFNPGHVYSTAIRGTGRPLKLQILDARNGSWGDNRGGLTVRIFARAAAPYVVTPPPPAPPAPAPPPPPASYEVSETVFVHANRPEAFWTRLPLAPGVPYLLEVSGVFSVWGDERDGVDAYYTYSPRRVGPQPQLHDQLLVDDRPMAEIARAGGNPVGFNPGHVYFATVRGTGQPLKLQIRDARDGSWQDNHGALQVRITRR
jgi:hypothetical protein